MQTETHRPGRLAILLAVCGTLVAGSAWAARPKDQAGFLESKAFFKPELSVSSAHSRLETIEQALANKAEWGQFRAAGASALAGGQPFRAYIDPRSGVASNIMGAFPLIPGSGVGNQITAASLGVSSVDAAAVAQAVRGFVSAHRGILGVDVSQLGEVNATQIHKDLWQFTIPQVYQGVPVRDGRVAGTIVKGNLVLIGAESWGNVRISRHALVSAQQALERGFAHVEGRIAQDELLAGPTLEILPVAPAEFQVGEKFSGPVGKGYGHRLVWSFVFSRPPDDARWETLVDAQSGEVLAFQDRNLYADRQITGGVYPVTSTEICPTNGTCGTMQSGWPMPFADTGFAAPNNFTDSAGVYDYTSGTATTTLTGRYVDIVDSCGAVNQSSATGSINMGGTNGQHDCTTGGGSAGNTPASRTAFYETNKLAEQARGWLPTNTWLQNRLTTNVNLNQTCNAFWNGVSINFYRSGGGCRNTGELAGVFDHEWGHGLDDNDTNGALSNSSEAYADIAAIYRLQDSCVGHGFFQTLNDGCGQTADGTGFNADENQVAGQPQHCDTNCSGVRDADYLRHIPNNPDTALGFVCSSCLTGPGPCGRQVHCAAAPVRQAAWDFVARDLQSAPFSLDSQTAFMVANKVFYEGSGNVGAWHACTCGGTSSGCGATNGYMQWLAADDDNGNVNDGTPHMTAIFNAFNRHGIACSTPTPVNSGCGGQPNGSTGPDLTATAGDSQVSLSWTSVAGASRYWLMRTEGHAGANFGKTRIANITGTSFVDTQVANGRTYWYNVVAQGSSPACYSRVSLPADQVTPTATVNPDFSLACTPASQSVQQGGSGNRTCTITSVNGFNSAVNLDCTGLPAGITCGYAPNPATPPANGTVNSTLTVSVGGSVAAGTYPFSARGVSGALTRTSALTVTVTQAPVPDFSVSASPTSVTVTQGGSGTSTITVTSINGFGSSVSLGASGLPSGVTASFNPTSVIPTANSTLTFNAGAGAATGTFPITVSGTSGGTTRTATVNLTVNGTGGADLIATFDAARQAPSCTTVGRSCDTGASLVLGRANLGPEPNQPNTIADSCADGTLGGFHSDESNDRIKVTSVDGTNFAAGKTVRIDATVWAWTTPSADAADFYYAANALSPTWTFIGTVVPTVVGAQTLSATYTLPAGGLQAVRVQFRYQSTSAACAAGSYNDRDDLVFAVTSAPVTTVYFDDFEAANGWATNPNGTDTATTGQWQRGDPAATTSSGTKQLGTTVSGVNDLVTGAAAGLSAGDFDVDGGVTSIQSGPITLPSSGTLTLSFSYYLAHGTNSSTADFLRVFVVGSTTSQVFQELGAANDDDAVWASTSVNISSFAGQTVRIRIEAADASTASLVEAGVDDVRITQQ